MHPTIAITTHWVLFIGTHLLMSHPPVRARLVARLGAGPFAAVYSLVAIALFAPMTWIWWSHRHEGPLLWMLRGGAVTHLTEGLVLVGLAVTVGGIVSPAPSSMGKQVQGPIEVRGMAAVSRHPVFMGLSLVAVGHLLVNGWAADVAFWAGFPVVTVLGGLHQDQRKSAENPHYADFIARTGFVPFTAPSQLPRIGGRALAGAAVGAALAVGLRLFHATLFG